MPPMAETNRRKPKTLWSHPKVRNPKNRQAERLHLIVQIKTIFKEETHYEKLLTLALSLALTATVGVASANTKLTVGASATPHAEILEAAKPILAEKGIDLEIVIFDDYVQPNLQLEAGDLDANYFQHIPYLENFNAENGTHLVSAGAVHYEPMGLYVNPAKSIALDSIPDGATIAIPNDTTNESRALGLLEFNGLIKSTPRPARPRLCWISPRTRTSSISSRSRPLRCRARWLTSIWA